MRENGATVLEDALGVTEFAFGDRDATRFNFI